ncbi:type II secretion system F family protein [Nitrospirillum sp. BR 11164]|uniref:type II secretion system F family protein n=1 Tax=Nitrospirillum sp. BR 11164 TaxID=3104324 RepID=UPI002AFE4232|nr:type II secretion system F family protein [Nitrospirillum sp. BR 11164]MEA1652762.1 type II secretion system F family protein [Nitrospirillum sp. BR 11164]
MTTMAMTNFTYRSVDANGRASRGTIEAADRRAAVDQLMQRGLTPLSIKAEGAGRASGGGGAKGLKRAERLSLVRDLANLVSAGFALEPALGLVADQMQRAAAGALVGEIRARVRAGDSLAAALAAQGGVFPPEFIGLVAAGEQGGSLAAALGHLATLEEDRAQFRQRLVSAMTYPALIGLLTLAALALMAGYVLPQFQDLFAGSKAKLPAATAAVLAIGDLLGRFGPGLLAGGALAVLATLRAYRQPELRLRMDRMLLVATGPLGRLIGDAQLALYTRTLASLLSGGVPLASALATAGGCVANRALAGAADRVRVAVRGGSDLSRAVQAEPLFPRRLSRMLAMAEQTASLPQGLLDLSKVLERERGLALDRALSLVTPVLTLVLGGMVGGIFAALIAGILSLNDIAL